MGRYLRVRELRSRQRRARAADHPLITREWRARARPSLAHAYPEHVKSRVLAGLARITGFLGASLSQRRIGERVEFLVLTRWESIKAIRAFAGAGIEKAVVQSAARAALESFDGHVRHYEVLEDTSA
ncbi:MAG: antibiotic biosynthesis monooxygenase [Steroidobacteraceae bacterium]